MHRIFASFLFIPLVLGLAACESPDQGDFHGYLYFAKASYLARFSLRDASLTIVDNRGNREIRDVSGFGPDKLLIAESESINRKNVSRISWIDLKTGQSTALYSGMLARFLSDSDVIVYDNGLKLFAVSLSGDPGGDEVIVSHRRNQLSAIIEVMSDVVLFEIHENGEKVIRSYDMVTGESRILDALSAACSLDGAVWIDEIEQLACRERSGDDEISAYILTSLEGEVGPRLVLPEGGQFLALTFVDSQGILILKEKWTSEFGTRQNSAVWAHDIRSGRNYRIAKNQNLGTSVVYAEL